MVGAEAGDSYADFGDQDRVDEAGYNWNMNAKRKSVEDRMYDFKEATDSLVGDELLSAVKRGLEDPSNLVVEMAAKAVLELEPGDCRPELVSAYRRFLIDPTETDKNCRAKLPIVEALNKQHFDDAAFYLEGMTYRQMEPAYGAPSGYEDTAAHLRGVCAYGLVDVPLASQNEMLCALVELLHDSEAVSREAAARALGATGLMAAAPLLRMKVLTGDARPEVIGACFSGLIQYRDDTSLEFVCRFLSSRSLDIVVEAGLALGESRQEAAVDRLIAATNEAPIEIRDSMLVSIGLSRSPIAIDYLVGLIEKNDTHSETAIQALAPVRYDQAVKDRILDAVNQTGSRTLAHAFRKHFA